MTPNSVLRVSWLSAGESRRCLMSGLALVLGLHLPSTETSVYVQMAVWFSAVVRIGLVLVTAGWL